MSFAFVVFHYPEPERREELLAGMREMAEQFAAAPGLVEVQQWWDEANDCLVGWSRWESREAFEALGVKRPPEGSPPPAGERAPRRRFYLELV